MRPSKLTLKNGGGQPKPYTLIYPNTCPLDGGMLRNDTLMLKTYETATAGRNHIGWLILILLVAVAIHATGSFWIGYISDDYDLLQRAPSVSIFRPHEGHHYSPVVTGLFKLASVYSLSPALWHGLALIAHMINTVLVFAVASIGLRQHKLSVLTITAIFAFSAAGYEALAWACSIGYVLVLTCILLALLGVLTVPTKRIGIMSVCLAFLQACALLIWDWGILLFPLVLVTVLAWRVRQKDILFSQVFLMLVPCAAMWFLLVVVKLAFGCQSGYHSALDNLVLGAKMVVAAPLTNLLPNTTVTFLNSTWGVLLACAIWVALCWSAIKSHVVMLALSLYFVCVLPVQLFGVLQSRYAYIATPFLCVAVVCAVIQLKPKHIRIAICLLLVLGHAVFAIQRSQLWFRSYRAASSLRAAIQSIRVPIGRDLVVVNLPDSFGPPNLIWRPFVWRNGLSTFGRDIKRVNTPGCPFTWSKALIPSVPRDQIVASHPGCEVYEVEYLHPDDWREFRLVSWRHGISEAFGESPRPHP